MSRIVSFCKPCLQALALCVLVQSAAQASEALARKNDCSGCHSVTTRLVGPSFKEVAAKYAGQPDALLQVQSSIREGSTGKWGELAMPAHPKLSAADLKKMSTWILGLQ